jgi:cysteine desulfurase/selenocysteine lyase
VTSYDTLVDTSVPVSIETIRQFIVGVEESVPLIDGRTRTYINFDNAASTPTISLVTEAINEFLKWYSNVHRGTGYKSKLSSWVFEEAREIIARFVNADLSDSVVLFCKNTTEAINKLAHRFPFAPGDVVLTSVMEHHSNELPWRKVAQVVHIEVLPDGRIDENDFKEKLRRYGTSIKLVAITGASNVAGFINPIHTYAQFMLDAAQLAPHRPIDMKPKSDPEHIDYLAFSAHKMYAPFGVGVLVGCKKTFEEGDPEYVGGGTVDIVTLENAYWTDLPDREEAGTPDIVGAVALAKAIRVIETIGWEKIIDHEAMLTRYALEKMALIPGVIIFGDNRPETAKERLGVIPFNMEGLPHALAASILSYEWGIGTRNGCFCAHPYVKCLLHVSETESHDMEQRILARDRSILPGFVRISFGIYNTRQEIDLFCEALKAIAQGNYRKDYQMNRERGEYYLDGIPDKFEEHFSL